MSDPKKCDCGFKEECGTHNDPSILPFDKGPSGRGCLSQSDTYRADHCKVFRCTRLCRVLSEVSAKFQEGEDDEQMSDELAPTEGAAGAAKLSCVPACS